MPECLGMNSVRSEDPFLVQVQLLESHKYFQEYSEKSKEEALKFATTFFVEDPAIVQVVDREGNIIFSHEQVQIAWYKYCEDNGITQYTFLVNTN